MTQCAYVMTEEQFNVLENQHLILQALVDFSFEGCTSKKEDIRINREALGTLFMTASYAIKDTLSSLTYGKVTLE